MRLYVSVSESSQEIFHTPHREGTLSMARINQKLNLSALFLLLACHQALLTEFQERQKSPIKRRISLQNTAEIQSCMGISGDVGCEMFQCFNNNSCEIRGLHHICATLLNNAGHFDSLGKSFVKDALRCMAMGLRQRFTCVSRRCPAVKAMVVSLQRECYSKHQLCLALQNHLDTLGDLVQFNLMFPTGPYLELVHFLMGCGEQAKAWVGQQLRGQCEQHWGDLCRSFTRLCPLQLSTLAPLTMVSPSTGTGLQHEFTGKSKEENEDYAIQMENTARSGHFNLTTL